MELANRAGARPAQNSSPTAPVKHRPQRARLSPASVWVSHPRHLEHGRQAAERAAGIRWPNEEPLLTGHSLGNETNLPEHHSGKAPPGCLLHIPSGKRRTLATPARGAGHPHRCRPDRNNAQHPRECVRHTQYSADAVPLFPSIHPFIHPSLQPVSIHSGPNCANTHKNHSNSPV